MITWYLSRQFLIISSRSLTVSVSTFAEHLIHVADDLEVALNVFKHSLFGHLKLRVSALVINNKIKPRLTGVWNEISSCLL